MGARMNDRIQQLALQAGFDKHHAEYDTCIKQFAELIVRECLTIVDGLVDRQADGTWTSTELYTDYNGALSEVKRRIEEHFGVEP